MRALIVDDEPLGRMSIRALLCEHKDFTEILEARNGTEAIDLIRTQRPTVVFLDVQMPIVDGFEVVRQIGAELMPLTIFVTAHDQYAIRAFEVNAIDYLLKPVDRVRFQAALDRTKARVSLHGTAPSQIASLLQSLAFPTKHLTRVAVRAGRQIAFVELRDVHWMQAAENYVELHLASGWHLLQVPMQTLEAALDPEVFLRIHRSVIVNLHEVKLLHAVAHGEYLFTLRSGAQVKSSRTYNEVVRRLASNPL
jgi:two-component system, LytTR family, response regulator